MDHLRHLSYFDIYEKHALHNGSLTALHWEGKETSFSDLFLQTAQFASGLKSLDLPEKARIAVLCKNHPVFFHLFGAASALNLTLVLANRRLSQDELDHIAADTTPTVLFCDPEMAPQAEQMVQSVSSIKHMFIVDDAQKDFSALYDHPPLDVPAPVRDTDPFVIIHTAAVEGRPRGAVLSQSNVILSNQQMIQACGIDQTKAYLNILPLFHIMGINLGLGTLQAGGRNIIQPKFNPTQALELIQEHQVNLFGSFPPILTSLLTAMEEKPFNLSSLDIIVGLEVPDIAKKWEDKTGSQFWTLYGQTETSGIISCSRFSEKKGTAGKITSLAVIKTADENDTILPLQETGEILVKGPLVFQGYWNADDLNARTFRNGWHHTGDSGLIDADGFLFFKGRKAEKELIKPGGENVFPAEVEGAIMEHDAVKEVCVFGVPDPKFGEGIKAVCALHPGQSLTKQELIDFCKQRIASYKKPGYVEFLEELPKTKDGRIDREKIKTKYA